MIDVVMRECWMLREDRRKSCTKEGWTDKPTWHVLVVEAVEVFEEHRGRGIFKWFINALCGAGRYDFICVEGVQNPILANALRRWGWECDERVMDFYSPVKEAANV